MQHPPRGTHGFTLIELSIVLVIIALISGAVMTGVSLRRAAELRSVATDLDAYKKAIVQFQTKYSALPGDMPNATSYWGSAGGSGAGTDSGCLTGETATSPLTCNGDGDGRIGTTDNTTAYETNQQEYFLAWKHLSDSGLVAGSYTGVSGSGGGGDGEPGQNIPAGKIGNLGYELAFIGRIAYAVNGWFPGYYNHVFEVGLSTHAYDPYLPAFTTTEGLALDTKADDGLPGTGNIRTFLPAGAKGNCATNGNYLTAVYDPTSNGYQCTLIFLAGF